jgi:membrane-associated phospholipid phosphatase
MFLFDFLRVHAASRPARKAGMEADRESPSVAWPPWARPALALGLLSAALLLDDQARAFAAAPWKSGQLNALVAASRAWGEGVVALGLALAAWRLQPRRWRHAVGILALPLLAGLAVDSAKTLSRRARPDEHAGPASQSWLSPNAAARNSSFPSGHAATAFALARALSESQPALKPVAFVCAASTGFSRMRERRHFLSDVVAGGLFGWWFSGLAWTLARRRLARQPERPADPPALRLVG